MKSEALLEMRSYLFGIEKITSLNRKILLDESLHLHSPSPAVAWIATLEKVKVQSWSIIRKWRPRLTPPLRLWRRLVSEAPRSKKIRWAPQTQPSWAPANSSSDKEVCDCASQCLPSEICVLDVSGAVLLLCPAHLIKRPVAISCSKLDQGLVGALSLIKKAVKILIWTKKNGERILAICDMCQFEQCKRWKQCKQCIVWCYLHLWWCFYL